MAAPSPLAPTSSPPRGPGPADLARAFGAGLLTLRYQPQVSLLTGAVTGADAVLHWDDPRWDEIPAARTRALAFEAGLDHSLADWMLQEACRQLQRWQARGVYLPRLSLRLPWSTLDHARTADRIADTLDDLDLPAHRLALEVPLDALLTPTRWLKHTLLALRSDGVHMALSGYDGDGPSLRALSELPVDELVLDSPLIQTLDHPEDPVARAAVGMAHALGWRSVASGLTHEGQVDRVRLIGCDEFRGSVLSDALPAGILGDVVAAAPVHERIVMTVPADEMELPQPPAARHQGPRTQAAHAA